MRFDSFKRVGRVFPPFPPLADGRVFPPLAASRPLPSPSNPFPPCFRPAPPPLRPLEKWTEDERGFVMARDTTISSHDSETKFSDFWAITRDPKEKKAVRLGALRVLVEHL